MALNWDSMLPSLSIHCAMTQEHVRISLTCVNQPQESNLDNHLSMLAPVSLHAEI